MAVIDDLRGLLSRLEANGDLCRVPVEVDPELEIAAITDRVCKSAGGGRALFFEKVRGHDFPVLTNLFGSPDRIAQAFGVDDVGSLAARLERDLAEAGGTSSAEALSRLMADHGPRAVEEAACRQVGEGEGADLGLLPALKSWQGDGGRFLTLPLVITRDPEIGRVNVGIYRMQVFDRQGAGMHWRPGSGGARHHAAWSRRGERMPVAVALGGPTALIYAASAALPDGIDELSFAGYLRGRPVETVRALHSDLPVPAAAEFVLEGYVEPDESRLEGPFGNHTGYYSPAAPYPVFHLTALTRRRDAIYPCTVVGRPPTENVRLAKAGERLMLPLLRRDFPAIVDINLPPETIFHGCALVAVREEATGSVRELIAGLWESPQLKTSRLLVLVDENVDVQRPAEVFWRAINHLDPARDILIDGGRIAVDATRRGIGPPVEADAETREKVARRWSSYGIK
jgi:4-hydroxy-3-polyprenylbenzoate decarboxylase